MIIEREISDCLIRLFRQYPIVTVTGPRQSGKTTLCRSAFSHLNYANLEQPDLRDFAESDPRGFFSRFGGGAILDEIQHVPDLLSYLQVIVDERGRNGLFVLTGSEQFRLSDTLTQSLAGRTALLRLLPFSVAEMRRTGAGGAVDDLLYSGFYPRIFDQGLDPREALGDYFENYVEREVRRLGGVRNLSSFRRFVRLCAGRVGQLVNLSSLGSDAGVSRKTVDLWLSILERSYIVFRLEPYYANVGRRLIKSPKLYFYDVGLASYLVGIQMADQLATHPLRGALFENMVVVEALKYRFNRGYRSNLSFFRDARGLECDLFYETGRGVGAIEIKAGSTVTSDYFRGLNRVAALVPEVSVKAVVHGGADRQSRSDCEVVPLAEFAGMLDRLEAEQQLATFVEEQQPVSQDLSDAEVLDVIHQRHVKPVLDGLESVRRSLAELFREDHPRIVSARGQSRTSRNGCLSRADVWQEMRTQIVGDGFRLSDEPLLRLMQSYRLGNYIGAGGGGFDVSLLIEWMLGSESFRRVVTINGEMVPVLEETVPYEEMTVRDAGADRAVAEISRTLLGRIRSLVDR